MDESSFNRHEWSQYAYELYKHATEGSTKRRKNKSARAVISSTLLEQAPTIHLEHEIAQHLKAADALRTCGRWNDASICLSRAACVYRYEMKDCGEQAAILLCEAASVAEMIEAGAGEEYFKKAVSLHCDLEQYHQAARAYLNIAQNFEKRGDMKEAVDAYKMTAQYHLAGHEGVQAIPCNEKAAKILTMNGEYEQASQLYYDIGISRLKYNMTKYQASNSFFRSVLLLMAIDGCDMDQIERRINDVIALDPVFRVSPGCDFLKNILSILQSIDIRGAEAALHAFSDHLYDYDKFYPFDLPNLEILNGIHLLHFQTTSTIT